MARRKTLPNKRHRRGLAVIVVLGLLAITLSLSYALLRTQGTAMLIARRARGNSMPNSPPKQAWRQHCERFTKTVGPA